ncbi:hypothetical protein GW17_00053856 [Ensete ventricosum]|nr:hypothetical protein GW17_00053856 [Ensete ventricosum]RZS04871.1 hypothetical protein BHM03_00035273 [Ensete ventricosum]
MHACMGACPVIKASVRLDKAKNRWMQSSPRRLVTAARGRIPVIGEPELPTHAQQAHLPLTPKIPFHVKTTVGLGTRCFPAMSCTIGLISLMCSPHKEGIAGTRYLDGVGTRIGIKLFRFLHRPPVAELEEGERKGSHLLPLVRSETMESVD